MITTDLEEIYRTPHIRLVKVDSGIILQVEDTELNDFVEDYLVEQFDILAEYVQVNTSVQPNVFSHHFPLSFDVSRLVDALTNLDLTEVDNIFKLNN